MTKLFYEKNNEILESTNSEFQKIDLSNDRTIYKVDIINKSNLNNEKTLYETMIKLL